MKAVCLHETTKNTTDSDHIWYWRILRRCHLHWTVLTNTARKTVRAFLWACVPNPPVKCAPCTCAVLLIDGLNLKWIFRQIPLISAHVRVSYAPAPVVCNLHFLVRFRKKKFLLIIRCVGEGVSSRMLTHFRYLTWCCASSSLKRTTCWKATTVNIWLICRVLCCDSF